MVFSGSSQKKKDKNTDQGSVDVEVYRKVGMGGTSFKSGLERERGKQLSELKSGGRAFKSDKQQRAFYLLCYDRFCLPCEKYNYPKLFTKVCVCGGGRGCPCSTSTS